MHGLKVNITFTLVLLLSVAMLLTNVVITTFWQRSLIAEQVNHYQRSLSILLSTIDNNHTLIKKYLPSTLQHISINCGGILTAGAWEPLASTTCDTEKELQKLAAQAIKSGQPATSGTGKTFGIFLPRHKYLHIAVPFPEKFSKRGAIVISAPLKPTWRALRKNQKIILVYILVNTLVFVVIGFFRLSSIIIRPIDRLVMATHNYSNETDLGFVSEQEENEFRQLSGAINNMVQRIDRDKIELKNTVKSLEGANKTIKQNQQEMIRTEKLASVGRLSAGLAHEIGNPLGIVLGYLGLLQKEDLTKEEKLDYINRSEQELNRINLLIRQLLDFSRPLSSDSESVHLHEVVDDILIMLQAQRKNKDITFTSNLFAQDDIVQGSKEALRQAFVNFFLNAIDAIYETSHPDQGKIIIESRIVQNETNHDLLKVTITDNGCGISATHMTSIFDPFYTTKDPGKGTGLGLSVSYGILEKYGGTVGVESNEDQGTTVTIQIPLADNLGN